MVKWANRGSEHQTEADQTADVWTGQARSAPRPSARYLMRKCQFAAPTSRQSPFSTPNHIQAYVCLRWRGHRADNEILIPLALTEWAMFCFFHEKLKS